MGSRSTTTRPGGAISSLSSRHSSSRPARPRAARSGRSTSTPFIDAQDWEIDAVDIAVREIAADKARATVTFKNAGKQRTVILDLVKLGASWRIADVAWDRNATLRKILTTK